MSKENQSNLILEWHRLKGFSCYPVSVPTFFIALACMSLIMYGVELFNFNISIDEEVWGEYFSIEEREAHWLQLGRWTLYFLEKAILPDPIIPTLPFVLGLVSCIFGAYAIVSGWRKSLQLSQVIAGVLIISFPTFLYILTFAMCYGVGIGFLFASLGVAAQLKFKSSRIVDVAAIVLYGVAIAAYQSLALLVPVVFMISVTIYGLTREEYDISFVRYFFCHGARIGGSLFLGLILYFMVWKALLLLTGQKPYYIDVYWHPELFLENPIGVTKSVVRSIISVFFLGDADLYVNKTKFMPVLIWICMVSLALAIYRAKLSFTEKIVLVISTACIVFMPFALHFFNNGSMPIRSVIALPVAIAGLFYLGLISSKGFWNVILIGISFFAILECSAANLRLQAANLLALEADWVFGSQIIARIEKEIARSGSHPKYITFVGFREFPETGLKLKREQFGASFFEWDNGNSGRMVLFLKVIGLSNLEFAPLAKRRTLIAAAIKLDNWPSDNSVKVINDSVIVKLSDYSSYQLIELCPTQADCASIYNQAATPK